MVYELVGKWKEKGRWFNIWYATFSENKSIVKVQSWKYSTWEVKKYYTSTWQVLGKNYSTWHVKKFRSHTESSLFTVFNEQVLWKNKQKDLFLIKINYIIFSGLHFSEFFFVFFVFGHYRYTFFSGLKKWKRQYSRKTLTDLQN